MGRLPERLRVALGELRRSERGIALPLVLTVTVIAMGFAAVPIVASMNTQRGNSHNQAGNEALAAAEAGAELAVLRQSEGKGPEGTGAIGAANYQYKVVASPSDPNAITAYSVGTARVGGQAVYRQVAVEAEGATTPSDTNRFLGPETIVGEESFTFSGGGNKSYGSVGTNGTFHFSGGSNEICGSLRYGEGTTAPGIAAPIGTDTTVPATERPYREREHNGICYPPQPAGSTVYTGKVTYPLPEAPSDIATNNSDGRFFSEDGRTLPSWYLQNPTNSWNPATKTLSIDSGVTLTLSGTKPYLLCRLRLEGGATIRTEAPGQPVSIFFEKPENCPTLPTQTLTVNGTSAKQQLFIAGGSHFTNNGYYPGLYFLGSSTVRSAAQVEIQDFNGLIYGPLTDFESNYGGLRLAGAIVARTVYLTGGSAVKSTFDGETYEIPVKGDEGAPSGFAPSKFVECTASPEFGAGC